MQKTDYKTGIMTKPAGKGVIQVWKHRIDIQHIKAKDIPAGTQQKPIWEKRIGFQNVTFKKVMKNIFTI